MTYNNADTEFKITSYNEKVKLVPLNIKSASKYPYSHYIMSLNAITRSKIFLSRALIVFLHAINNKLETRLNVVMSKSKRNTHPIVLIQNCSKSVF